MDAHLPVAIVVYNYIYIYYIGNAWYCILVTAVFLSQPRRRMVKLNSYVVPTDKKRLSLRWAIRHQMAQQD